MPHPLIGVHAFLGELGILAFLWLFVELFNFSPKNQRRIKIAALVGMVAMLASWVAGGYYYVNYYGPDVKPVIKEGPASWAHGIAMEAKEHIFLFIPFLAISVYALTKRMTEKERYQAMILSGLVVLLGLLMVGMGYLISTGFRAAMEARL